MATITFQCPGCERTARVELTAESTALACPACGKIIAAYVPDFGQQSLSNCLVCPSKELFQRKDFPQRLGVAIVVAGFAASCITWYFHNVVGTFAILFGTALIDVVLYVFMGNLVECYACHAQYRGLAKQTFEAFNLEVHERHRQQAIRLKEKTAGSIHQRIHEKDHD